MRRWLLSLAILVNGCIPFGDAWFNFDGTVRTLEGRPLPGATVTILVNGESPSARATTISDPRGHYKLFENSCPCDFAFELVVSKAGYSEARISKSAKEANAMRTLDI